MCNLKLIRHEWLRNKKRHEYNFKVFMRFLKENHIYALKKVIFDDSNRTRFDLFKKMNIEKPMHWAGFYSSKLTNDIDRSWAIIFCYAPYLACHWNEMSVAKHFDTDRMYKIVDAWKEYLYTNRLD